MRRWIVVSLLAAAGGGACGNADDAGGGNPLPSAQIQFQISDGTTAQGSAPIVMSVYDHGLAVDDALLSDLAGRVALRTWPEDALVGFDVEGALNGQGGQHVLRLSPAAALDDRWYIAAFDSLPARVHVSTPSGQDGVRFRPGSHPRVASVQFCVVADPTAARKMVVGFSEPVAGADGRVSLSVAGQPSTCSQYGVNEAELYFTCPGLTPTASVTVSVAAGASGVSGVAMEPSSFNVDLARLPAADCRLFTPPL
jgi:hypothetical protein